MKKIRWFPHVTSQFTSIVLYTSFDGDVDGELVLLHVNLLKKEKRHGSLLTFWRFTNRIIIIIVIIIIKKTNDDDDDDDDNDDDAAFVPTDGD